MSENNSNELIEDKLKFIFANVNEWLKFAEAKNAALTVFNSAIVIGVIQSYNSICSTLQYYAILLGAMAFISVCFNIFSFMPTANLFFISEKELFKESYSKKRLMCKSIFHTSHISVYPHHEFLIKVYEYYSIPQPVNFLQAELDLAHQITTNSQIAHIKYLIFKWSGIIILTAMILPVPFVVWYIISEERKKRKLLNTAI